MSKARYSKLPDEDEQFNKRLEPQVQNVKGKKVYIFGDGDVQSDSLAENTELNVLVTRGNSSYNSTAQKSHNDYELRQIPLEPTDTLQAISIKFRCSVAELKRVNGLMNDSEFYGLRVLKIPVKPHELHKQDEVAAYIKQHDKKSTYSGKKRNAGASVVSSETSDEETDSSVNHSHGPNAHSVEMFSPHSDSEDSASLALLDRRHPHHKHSRDPSHSERKKFEKFMDRKDGIMADIMRSAQQRADSVGSITRSMDEPVHHTRSEPRRCVGLSISPLCLLIFTIVVLIASPIIFYIISDVVKRLHN